MQTIWYFSSACRIKIELSDQAAITYLITNVIFLISKTIYN
jgi:hypothetical protein